MADLYAPQGVDLGGVAPPLEKWNDTVRKKWPEQDNEKIVKWHLKI